MTLISDFGVTYFTKIWEKAMFNFTNLRTNFIFKLIVVLFNMRKLDSLSKILKAGTEGDNRRGQIVGWPHRLNGHEFEQALGVGDGQGSLACCSSLGCKESDTTE